MEEKRLTSAWFTPVGTGEGERLERLLSPQELSSVHRPGDIFRQLRPGTLAHQIERESDGAPSDFVHRKF